MVDGNEFRCWIYISSGTYVCSVAGIFVQGCMPVMWKCMFMSVAGHIIDYIAFV